MMASRIHLGRRMMVIGMSWEMAPLVQYGYSLTATSQSLNGLKRT
jgi:hypothetical protein